MAPLGSSLLDILEPPGNRWLEGLAESDQPLPEGVRVVRNEDGECEIFESGTPPHRSSGHGEAHHAAGRPRRRQS
jgi:hypothetical protein